MRSVLSFLLFISVFNVFSQESQTSEKKPNIKIDSLYREDQFYFGFTYNSLQKKPDGLSQGRFSTGLSAGFLRDMPVNKARTVAIAPGIGICYNKYHQNLAITGTSQIPVYTVIPSSEYYTTNRFSQLLVEAPIELRWRNSTPESYKFWRVYGGFKFSYLVYDKSTFDDDKSRVVIENNNDFNPILYGTYISVGYNTWNVYAHYGLNSLFKSGKVNGEDLEMHSLNIGIIFYIL